MKNFFRQNGLLLVLIALLLSVLIGVGSALLGGNTDPLSNVVNTVASPIRGGVSAVMDWAEGVYTYVFHYQELHDQLSDLQVKVSQLEEQVRQGEEASRENEQLRQLLQLQAKRRDFTFESARVTTRSTSNWESTLTIGKGSAAGIAVDDCVVDEYWNLVGVVAEVGENWATVRTLVDSDTEMGGQLARTGGAAILEGDFALMGEGRLKLTYLPENSELIAGDLVTTSGRGGVYPAGLVAGHVEEVRTDASGMTRYAVIAPETDLDGLQQVFVITDFTVNE